MVRTVRKYQEYDLILITFSKICCKVVIYFSAIVNISKYRQSHHHQWREALQHLTGGAALQQGNIT